MKLTKSQLRKIIKEEIGRFLSEASNEWRGAGQDPAWNEKHPIWVALSKHTGLKFILDWLDLSHNVHAGKEEGSGVNRALGVIQYMGPTDRPGAIWNKDEHHPENPFEMSDHSVNKDWKRTGFWVGEVGGKPAAIMRMPGGNDHLLVSRIDVR
jgi:hypothetical protein